MAFPQTINSSHYIDFYLKHYRFCQGVFSIQANFKVKVTVCLLHKPEENQVLSETLLCH